MFRLSFLRRPAQHIVNLIMVGSATLLGLALFFLSPLLPSVLSDDVDGRTPQTQVNSDTTQAGNLGGWLWYDADGDGIRDSGEPGLGRVTLDLWLDDGDGRFEPAPALGSDTFVTMSTTDWAGRYDFALPALGGYFVDVRDMNNALGDQNYLTSGQSDPTSLIPVAQNGGTVVDGINFGYVTATDVGEAVVGDLVWLDANRNGTDDPGEPVIAGVKICATPLDGTAAFCTLTDGQGRYRLRVPIGGYTIGPAAFPVALLPTTSTKLSRYLLPGEQALNADFGFAGDHTTATATLGGTVWQDLAVDDGTGDLVTNGILDAGETGIPGVSVRVGMPDPFDKSGQWNESAPALVLISDADGTVSFSGLTPDAYLVKVTDELGRLRNFAVSSLGPTPGADGQNQAQPFAATLLPGEVNTRADFGYRAYEVAGQPPQPGPGAIGDLIWFDRVVDGIYDPAAGDLPAARVTVDLYQNGLFLTTATTDAQGRYLFAGLGLGNFKLAVSDRFRQLVDFETSIVAPIPSGIPSAHESNRAQPYAPTLGFAGFEDRNADFGYRAASSTYSIVQQVSPAGAVRVGEEVRFTVRITNTGTTWLTTLPLQVVYDTAYLRLARTTVAADDGLNDGRLDWGDLTAQVGDLAPAGQANSSLTLVITFIPLADTGGLADFQTPVTALAHQVHMDPDGPGGAGESAIPLADRAATAGTTIIYPTATTVVESRLTPTASGVLITWRTVTEATLVGFNLVRIEADGSSVRLNTTMIPARGAGQPGGVLYEWEDATLSTLGKIYILEVVDADGTISQRIIDPVAAERVLFLPLITNR